MPAPEPSLPADPRFASHERRSGWSLDDGRHFLEWSMSRMESRSERLLGVLGIPFDPHPVRLIRSITPPLRALLTRPEFRGPREMGVDTVNQHGRTVAFDLGLLLCRVILRVADPFADPSFTITVLRRPKSDLF